MTILPPVTALTVKLPAQRYRVAISCIAQMRCADRTEHDRFGSKCEILCASRCFPVRQKTQAPPTVSGYWRTPLKLPKVNCRGVDTLTALRLSKLRPNGSHIKLVMPTQRWTVASVTRK
jgi:hypothetical protein